MNDTNTTTYELQVSREDQTGGKITMTAIDTFKYGVTVKLINVKQVGATITGGVQVKLETPFFDISETFPFAINTGLANPIKVALGSVAGFPVVAEFSFDIPMKKICVELVLGPFSSGKLCVNW